MHESCDHSLITVELNLLISQMAESGPAEFVAFCFLLWGIKCVFVLRTVARLNASACFLVVMIAIF